MTMKDEYERCLAAYKRGDPFSTEALARNCPAYIAQLEWERDFYHKRYQEFAEHVLDRWRPKDGNER